MTVSSYMNLQVNAENNVDVNTTTAAENEEGLQSELQVQPITEYQSSILQSLSDTCCNMMKYVGNLLPNFNLPKASISEQLITKNSILTTKSETPITSSSPSTPFISKTFAKNSFQSLPQQAKSSAPTTTRVLAWCPSQRANQFCKQETQLQLPRLRLSGRQSLMMLSFKTIAIPLFSKAILRLQPQPKTQISTKSENSHLEEPTTSIKTKEPLSPMTLFSHIQETKYSSSIQYKQSKKDSEQEHQQQQQQQGQHDQQHQQHKKFRITDISDKTISYTTSTDVYFPHGLPEEIVTFALSEAQLSSIVHMRVSHYDILKICAEIMKLMLNSKELDVFEKRQTKKAFLEEAKRLEDSFSRQAQISRWIGMSTAVLGIIGASSPLFGEIAGDQILNFVQKHAGIWKNATSHTFFKSAGKVFTSLSQLSETASKIYELQESSHRTAAENYKELMRLGYDEAIRTIEETKDHWKNMDNLLLQILHTQHESTCSLYN